MTKTFVAEIKWPAARNKSPVCGGIHNVHSVMYCSGFNFQVTERYGKSSSFVVSIEDSAYSMA